MYVEGIITQEQFEFKKNELLGQKILTKIPMVCIIKLYLLNTVGENMTRNKYPEKTKEKILETAKKLFLEKGYDNTSIQDILKELGGLTKGAIYHHFNSKFEILETIMTNSRDRDVFYFKEGNTGLEKIKNSISISVLDFEKQSIWYSASVVLNTPRVIGEQYISAFKELVPKIKDVILEGIEDGSIKTKFPEEAAELLIMFLNLWIGLRISNFTVEQFINKVKVTKLCLDAIDAPFIDDSLIERVTDSFEKMYKVQ